MRTKYDILISCGDGAAFALQAVSRLEKRVRRLGSLCGVLGLGLCALAVVTVDLCRRSVNGPEHKEAEKKG